MALEARYKAEKIEYPVVGEKTKESSDVVDYNINEEVTKDVSAEFNANNDTTTGMANVIPGVNAPKLRAETSIAGGGMKNIVSISDYKSIKEWQPVVERVLNGERLCVKCVFTEYAALTNYYFIPVSVTNQRIRFQCAVMGDQQMKVNCYISGTTITSITTGHSSA